MKNQSLICIFCAALVLGLAACSGKSPTSSPGTEAETTQTEAPFVEEEPVKNELNSTSPIPKINKDYDLTEQIFEEENLILRLPKGVTAVNEGRGKNMGHITVTDEEDGWKLMFRPDNFSLNNIVNNVSNTVIYDGNVVKTDWSKDVAGTLSGFPVRVWANNIRKGWLHPSNETDTPAVDIIVDYGETLVGEWLGMHIRLEALNPKDDTNIYHYLYNSKLRAVLNSFECIKTPDGKEYTANGITASFPARWPVKAGENSLVANMHSNALTGGITMSTQYNPDPQHHVDQYEGEQFNRTYGSNDWIGVIAKHTFEKDETSEPTILYSMHLFSKFSDRMCANVHVSNNSFGPDEFKAFLDNEQFVDLMNSVKLDPDAWHQPGTAEVNGLLSDGGSIMSYSGSDEEVDIPSVIGDYNTVYIGFNAFKGNTSVRKIVIPEGVTEIQGNAFFGCTNLETVVLPETLNFIYQNAFRDCPNLKDVVLPDSVSYVGSGAYEGSGTGTFKGSSAEYDSHAFDESGFDKISFAAGAVLSADYIFDGAKLSEIEFPSDLKELGMGAFVNCHNIQRIELPETVTTIGESAFASMFGLPYITLPEGLTEIPEGCFNSTTLDTLVIPSTVTKIGDSATFGAACIVILCPEAEIGERAIQADYVYMEDAYKHVFSDHQELEGSCLYLDGVYDAASQLQGHFYDATSFSYQVYLPSDATVEEADALDRFLLSIGYQDIAWIGSSRDFIPDSTFDFDCTSAGMITGYHGNSDKLGIPNYHLYRDDDWWLTGNVYGIVDEAFKDSTFTSAYFRGQCGDGIGSRILAGNTALKDIWFNTSIINEIDSDNSASGIPHYQPDTFEGIPDDVTVHLPEAIPEDLRSGLEESLRAHGIPTGAKFVYYSLR